MLISLSQISETCCILLIPFFMKRYGIKNVMLIAMMAWVLRFGLFALGNPGSGVWMFILSMIVYGVAFDFFNISGSLFVEQNTDTKQRSSAQGLFMLMTNGIGATIGTLSAQAVVNAYTVDGVTQWAACWYVFAGYALVVAVAFALIFRPKTKSTMKNNPKDIARVNSMLTDCVELKLHDVVCIVGADELRLMILTDSVGKRQISAICDRAVEKELVFRMHKTDCQGRLPEVLCSLMPGLCRDDYALYVYDITDGTYHVHLVNRRTAEETEIRITDAVLLSMVANIPLLTSHAFFEKQALPFDQAKGKLRMPVNAMTTEQLREHIKRAVADEYYEDAANIKRNWRSAARSKVPRRPHNERSPILLCAPGGTARRAAQRGGTPRRARAAAGGGRRDLPHRRRRQFSALHHHAGGTPPLRLPRGGDAGPAAHVARPHPSGHCPDQGHGAHGVDGGEGHRGGMGRGELPRHAVSERRSLRADRIDKIVVAAMKQSRKAWKPVVNEMASFRAFVDAHQEGRRFICHCYPEIVRQDFFDAITAQQGDAAGASDDITVLVGPEGDFSVEEVRYALDRGYESVSLGKSRLRTETAGLTAVVMASWPAAGSAPTSSGKTKKANRPFKRVLL